MSIGTGIPRRRSYRGVTHNMPTKIVAVGRLGVQILIYKYQNITNTLHHIALCLHRNRDIHPSLAPSLHTERGTCRRKARHTRKGISRSTVLCRSSVLDSLCSQLCQVANTTILIKVPAFGTFKRPSTYR